MQAVKQQIQQLLLEMVDEVKKIKKKKPNILQRARARKAEREAAAAAETETSSRRQQQFGASDPGSKPVGAPRVIGGESDPNKPAELPPAAPKLNKIQQDAEAAKGNQTAGASTDPSAPAAPTPPGGGEAPAKPPSSGAGVKNKVDPLKPEAIQWLSQYVETLAKDTAAVASYAPSKEVALVSKALGKLTNYIQKLLVVHSEHHGTEAPEEPPGAPKTNPFSEPAGAPKTNPFSGAGGDPLKESLDEKLLNLKCRIHAHIMESLTDMDRENIEKAIKVAMYKLDDMLQPPVGRGIDHDVKEYLASVIRDTLTNQDKQMGLDLNKGL